MSVFLRLQNTVKKLYLEDFAAFCESLGGRTAEVMGELLGARADAVTIAVTLNSFDTFYNQPSHRTSSRKSLYPALGRLYPDGTEAMSKVDDEDGVGRVLDKYLEYRRMWEHCPVEVDDGSGTGVSCCAARARTSPRLCAACTGHLRS